MTPEGPEQLDFPHNWDHLEERGEAAKPSPGGVENGLEGGGAGPLRLSLFAAAWADTVTITAVCTLALLALFSLGYRATVPAFPWAAAVGLVWWSAAASTTLVVRRGTPGMLLAGVVFADRLSPQRILLVLAAALVHCCSLGLLSLLGARHSVLRLAAKQELITVDAQQAAAAD